MFVLRIAGDVDGVKRNIEVSFPHRPSLQQVCTVAETILPLRDRRNRRPWRLPRAAALQDAGDVTASTAASSRDPVDANPRAPGLSAIYTVESLVYLNRATHEWEELYSASQLPSGSQVYCFSYLQHGRVAAGTGRGGSAAIPSSSFALPVGGEHVNEAAPRRLQVPASLPGGTGVQQSLADPDCPGDIPEPQQRLVWDYVSGARGGVRQGPQGAKGGFSRVHSASPSLTQTSARNKSTAAHDFAAGLHRMRGLPPFSSHSRRLSSLSPSGAVPFAASARPALSPTSGTSPRALVTERSLSFCPAPTFSTHSRHAVVGLVQSTAPTTRRDCSSLVGVQAQMRSPAWRQSTLSRLRDDRYTFISDLRRGWSVLLSDEDGCSSCYAHLGDRLDLLFDVLVHLDPQEEGTGQRPYILLRDFYLLASCLTSTSTAAAALSRTTYASMSRDHVTSTPSTAMDITSELDAQLHWSWDDVVRHADKDRDGCIAYREWISFGIEHPEVVQLLCRAVHALLVREARSSRGFHADRHSSTAAQTPAPAFSSHFSLHSTSSMGHLGDRNRNSDAELSGVYQCCRRQQGGIDKTNADKGGGMRATDVHERHGRRCSSCHELRARLSEGCGRKASAQANIVFSPMR
ncbi:hypothetical protein, conserved [Leishmania tarentolae]|uniref:EF-hand domain-containing protein n=1 Tax=Leishmania tarentolae TaxID=5689 RepID=A0A640KIY0_LEITA|nr:hypothetical protein, conserved [Leishmania tarentolae]